MSDARKSADSDIENDTFKLKAAKNLAKKGVLIHRSKTNKKLTQEKER